MKRDDLCSPCGVLTNSLGNSGVDESVTMAADINCLKRLACEPALVGAALGEACIISAKAISQMPTKHHVAYRHFLLYPLLSVSGVSPKCAQLLQEVSTECPACFHDVTLTNDLLDLGTALQRESNSQNSV